MDISALARLAGEESAAKAPNLTDFQIIERLRSIHELTGETTHFEPGQIVRHKFPDLANSDAAKTPGIFVRYLDKPVVVADHPEAFDDITDWASMLIACQYDCVVGVVLNGNYLESMEPSSHYHLATEDDYGPVVNPND